MEKHVKLKRSVWNRILKALGYKLKSLGEPLRGFYINEMMDTVGSRWLKGWDPVWKGSHDDTERTRMGL